MACAGKSLASGLKCSTKTNVILYLTDLPYLLESRVYSSCSKLFLNE